MKKFLALLIIAFFPYSPLIITFFVDNLVDKMNMEGFTLFSLLAFGLYIIIAGIMAIWVGFSSLGSKWNNKKFSFANMIIKIFQTPVYLVTFGTFFLSPMLLSKWAFIMLPIFAIIIPMLMTFNFISICLTGIVGACVAKRNYDERTVSSIVAILIGLLQFVFFIDVICSIFLFIKAMKNSKDEEISLKQ